MKNISKIVLIGFVIGFSFFSWAEPSTQIITRSGSDDTVKEHNALLIQQGMGVCTKHEKGSTKLSDCIAKVEREKSMMEASKEKCQEVADNYKTAAEKKTEQQKTSKEKFYELDTEMTNLEKTMGDTQKELAEKLNALQVSSNKKLQSIRDNTRTEVQKIDRQIEDIKNKIHNLKMGLEQLTVETEKLHSARTAERHKRYTFCYNNAQKQLTNEQAQVRARRQTGRLSSSNLQSLAKGTEQNLKTMFHRRFNQHLHFCLNNEAAQKEKQDELNRLNIALKTIHVKKKNFTAQIRMLEAQIKQLSVSQKSQILIANKEQLQNEAKQFNKDYQRATANFERSKQHVQKQSTQIKSKQTQERASSYSMQKMTPQDQRTAFLLYQCQKQDPAARALASAGQNENNPDDLDDEALLEEAGLGTQ